MNGIRNRILGAHTQFYSVSFFYSLSLLFWAEWFLKKIKCTLRDPLENFWLI